MTECQTINEKSPILAPGMPLSTGMPAGISGINTSALVANESVNVMQDQRVNTLEIPKKDGFNVQGDTASSGICSVIFNGEPVVYKGIDTGSTINANSQQQGVNNMFPGMGVEGSANSDMQNLNPVTHIEIINQLCKPTEVLKSKPGLSRRVTGANRVVPLITSLWQKGELKAIEPTLHSTYKAVLDNPESTEERRCEICYRQFLCSTEVEEHVRSSHREEFITPQQCFVCTKMYVFEAQLKRHLSLSHGIQYPEMICKICFMEFNSVIEKKAHERKHDKIYTCHVCSSKFASEYSCQKHYTEHLIAKKPYQCKKCGKRFSQKNVLSVHNRRHGQHFCSICCLIFKEELQFLLHVKNHEPHIQINFLNSVERLDQEENQLEEMLNTYFQANSSNCDSWKFTEVDQDVSRCVDSMVNAVSHAFEADIQPSELSKKNGVECKLCGLEMSSAADLLDHRRKSHLRSRTCPFCGKRSRSVSQMCRHMATHIGRLNSNKKVAQSSKTYKTDVNETENAFECQLCNKVFPNKGKQNHHLEAIHKMNVVPRPYSCTTCDRKFQFKSTRDRHMLVHSKEKKGCWKCALCDQAFLRPKFLLRHIKDHEAENVCPVCNKTFKNKTKLKLHLKSHNPLSARNRLKCSVCLISCPTISGLREHIRTHTGARPYSCGLCELKFKRSQALKQHMKGVHNEPDSASYVCSLCAAAFNRKGNLMRHILVNHHGVRRFICGACGHRYAQNQDLRKHLRNTHQMKLSNIPGTEKKAVNEVHVFPPLEALPSSHVQRINIVIDEEKCKIQQLLALGNDTNISTDAEHTTPLRRTLEMVNATPVPIPEEHDHLNVTFQPKEFPELVTNKGPITFVKDQSFIPLHNLHICARCNNVTFRGHENIADHENNSISCKQCSSVREELPDLRSESNVVKHSVVVAEQGNASLENLSSSISEGIINDTFINEILINGIEESLYESLATLMNHDVGTGLDQMLTQNGMLQPSSTVPVTFSNINSVLENNSSPTTATLPLNKEGALPLSTLPEISVETDNCTSNKALVEEKNEERSVDTANGEAYPETGSSPLPQISDTPDTTNDDVKNIIYDCKICKKKFECKSACERHMKTHSGEKSFRCLTCDKLFKYKQNLKAHTRIHTGERPYKCSQCSKSFRYRKDLSEHEKRHQGIKPYVCSQCGKEFLRRGDLKRHEDIHSNKGYKCPVCNRMFRRLDQLKMVHMQTHEQAKRHMCEQCKKYFPTNLALKKHTLLHSGKKMYDCTLCSKSFMLKSYLKSHIKTHEKQENYLQCPICPRKFATESTLQTHISKFHRGHNKNAEGEQHITNTNTDTETECPESTMITIEPYLIDDDRSCDLLEDAACNAVIYLQMFPENEVPLFN